MILSTIVRANLLHIVKSCYSYYAKYKYVNFNIHILLLFLVKVQNLLVEVLTLTSVRVSWERLDFSEITQYLVYYTQTENRKRQVESLVKVPATSGSVVISNLTSGRSYLFEVQAEVVLDGIVIVGPRSDRNTVNTVIFTEIRGGSKSFFQKG